MPESLDDFYQSLRKTGLPRRLLELARDEDLGPDGRDLTAEVCGSSDRTTTAKVMLGADATNGEAVARIYAAKGRPSFNPLISHVADIQQAKSIAVMDERAEKLADTLWPGPLSIVMNKTADCAVSDLTTAGLSTIAVRIPARERARRFLAACGVPVAAPSANASGAVSPSLAVHVQTSLPGPEDGGPQMILDDGPCEVGLESTVVDLSTPVATLLRPGGVSREELERVLGPVALKVRQDGAPLVRMPRVDHHNRVAEHGSRDGAQEHLGLHDQICVGS